MGNLFVLLAVFTLSSHLYAGKVTKALPKRGIYVVDVKANENSRYKVGDIVRFRSKKFRRPVRGSVIQSKSRKVVLKVNTKKQIARRGDRIALTKLSNNPRVGSSKTTNDSNFAGYYIGLSLPKTLLGYYNGSFGMVVSDSITLGLSGFYKEDNQSVKGFAFGTGVDSAYYFTAALKDSIYLTLKSDYLYAQYEASSLEISTEGSWLGVCSMLGYQWLWDSGIKLSSGIGAQKYFVVSSEAQKDDDSIDISRYLEQTNSIRPALDISLGYVF